MGGRQGRDVEGGHAGLAEGGQALGDVAFRADERDLLGQLGGHQGLGLGLAAVQVGVLDRLGLGLVAEPAGQVVVEVAAPGAHPADVQGQLRAAEVAQAGHVVADGQRGVRDHVQRAERRVALGAALGDRLAPYRAGPLRQVEDRHPGLGQLGGDGHVLRADGGQGDRDALPDGMVDQLERLAQPGAPLQRQVVVLALVGQPVAAPDHPADLDDLAGPADRRVVRDAVPALDDLRAGRAQAQREPAARDVVQPGRGHREQRGRARVQREDPRGDLHPLGLGRDEAELAHRVEAVRLGHEHDVGPGPLVVGQFHYGLGETARVVQKDPYPHDRRVSGGTHHGPFGQ